MGDFLLDFYLSPFFKYLTCNFDDLELGEFKVIQGQSYSLSKRYKVGKN